MDQTHVKDWQVEYSLVWRNIPQKGHEFCQLHASESGYSLEGTAVFLHKKEPWLLIYQISCDIFWQTISARIGGWVGNERVGIQIEVDPEKRWWLNEVEVPDVSGCIDLDLNFSPATNMLPIRRLDLEIGEKADFTAAWLKFPGFKLEPLQQVYERFGKYGYRYTSRNGAFMADLQTNPYGFVIDYPGIWAAETD